MTCMAYDFECTYLMVEIDWPAEFGTLAETGSRTEARSGDQRSRTVLVFVARALDQLRNLAAAASPGERDAFATLRWVRQSRRYPLWRVRTPTTRRRRCG